MRQSRLDPRTRAKLLARDVALRFPRAYTSYQLGHGERIRRRIDPTYEPEIRALARWASLSAAIRNIVDIGANLGQSCWSFSRHLPRAEIRAFEANPLVADRCRLLLRSRSVRVDALALGPIPASVVLHMPVYRGVPFPGLASMDAESAHDWFGPELIRGFREEELAILEVPCEQAALDELHLRPDLIKIDVEGTECDVIRGALATIESVRPILLVECNRTFDEIKHLLEPYEYLPFELKRGNWAESTGARLNQLFAPRLRLEHA